MSRFETALAHFDACETGKGWGGPKSTVSDRADNIPLGGDKNGQMTGVRQGVYALRGLGWA